MITNSRIFVIRKSIFFRIYCVASLAFFPAFTTAEPKEQLYGKDQTSPYEAGWPLRVNPPNRLAALDGRALKALFGKRPVWMEPPPGGVRMPAAPVKFGFFHNPSDLLKKHPIIAIALGKDGKIVFEQYKFGTSDSSLFDSQSIAKTITGLTLGVVIQKGHAINLDSKMAALVPHLKESPVGESTVRQALNMQCGHKFKWIDDGERGSAGKYAAVKFAIPAKGGREIYEYFKEIEPNTPGQTFAYDPHCSDSISMLITEKTGMPMRRFFEDHVWRKLGPTGRAAWLSLKQNPELTSGANSFYATLPDYSLLANAIVNGGMARGESVIPADWIEKMRADNVAVGKDENKNFARYGYQSWVRNEKADSWFAGLGNYGQRFYLDPKNKSFMIIFALDFDHIKDSDSFWEWFRTTPLDKL
jgi:CubicO group peptidase (beta-lactamase class C family)